MIAQIEATNKLLNDMLGGNGTYGISTTPQTGKKYRYIRINEAAIITHLATADGSVLAAYGLDSIEWGAGTIIKLTNETPITEITLSQGSAQGII